MILSLRGFPRKTRISRFLPTFECVDILFCAPPFRFDERPIPNSAASFVAWLSVRFATSDRIRVRFRRGAVLRFDTRCTRSGKIGRSLSARSPPLFREIRLPSSEPTQSPKNPKNNKNVAIRVFRLEYPEDGRQRVPGSVLPGSPISCERSFHEFGKFNPIGQCEISMIRATRSVFPEAL